MTPNTDLISANTKILGKSHGLGSSRPENLGCFHGHAPCYISMIYSMGLAIVQAKSGASCPHSPPHLRHHVERRRRAGAHLVERALERRHHIGGGLHFLAITAASLDDLFEVG